MAANPGAGAPRRYEFVVAATVSDAVRSAFPELSTVPGPVGGTVFFGPVRDRSEIDGLLARFADLGLAVIEMRQLPD